MQRLGQPEQGSERGLRSACFVALDLIDVKLRGIGQALLGLPALSRQHLQHNLFGLFSASFELC